MAFHYIIILLLNNNNRRLVTLVIFIYYFVIYFVITSFNLNAILFLCSLNPKKAEVCLTDLAWDYPGV